MTQTYCCYQPIVNAMLFRLFRFVSSGHKRGSRSFGLLSSSLISACLAVNSAAEAGNGKSEFANMSLQELTELEVFDAASLLPTKPNKAPGTVYSFQREDFSRLGVRRLDDLLAYVPGIQLNQYRKRHRSIWARGQLNRFNDKLVLMVDGIRRQHVYYGNFSLGDNFPLEKIEKVEIIMGPASTLYGANAFGGIISVTTRDFSEQTTLEASGEGGSNARAKGTLLFNDNHLQAFGSYLGQDAPFRGDRKSFIGGESLQPLDEDYGNLFAKASPIDGLTLSADYYHNNTPFLFIPNTQDAFINEETLTLSGQYETGDLDNGKLQANVYYTWDNAREHEIEQLTRRLGYQENQNAVMAGSTVTGFKRLWDDHVLALGVNWMHTEAINMDYARYFHFRRGFLNPPLQGSLLSDPEVSNDDFAVFAQHIWSIVPELELTLGARYDHFEQFGDYPDYRGALVYSPDERQTVKLLYGTGIRTPTFREYLKVLPNSDFNAPIPDPERIESLELGYGYQWEHASLNVTLFNNEIDDYIYQTPTPDGKDVYFTNSRTPWEMRGVETVVQWQALDDLELRLSAALLDAKDGKGGKLPYLANWTGNLNVTYRYHADHRLGVTINYSDSRPDRNAYVADDPRAFITANLFGSGKIIGDLSYMVGVDNLFDTRIYDPAADFGSDYNTERSAREIWGRLSWRFNP